MCIVWKEDSESSVWEMEQVKGHGHFPCEPWGQEECPSSLYRPGGLCGGLWLSQAEKGPAQHWTCTPDLFSRLSWET